MPACVQAEAVGGGSRDPSTYRGALSGGGALDVLGQFRRE